MKKRGILNVNLSKVIAEMGHTDKLVIADAGLPIPETVQRIDLALIKGVPRFLETLAAVLNDLVVEKAVLTEEFKAISPALHNKTREILGEIPVQYLSHQQFKAMTRSVKGVVRTGEITPYANIILLAGVDF